MATPKSFRIEEWKDHWGHGGGHGGGRGGHGGKSARAPPPPPPLHRGEISDMGWQYNYGGASTGVPLPYP